MPQRSIFKVNISSDTSGLITAQILVTPGEQSFNNSSKYQSLITIISLMQSLKAVASRETTCMPVYK